MIDGIGIEIGAGVVSLRGTRAIAGNAVRAVVRDAQDAAVVEDVGLAERLRRILCVDR